LTPHPIGFTRVDLGTGVDAGFTNRFGGVSSAPWDSLNLGPNVSDVPDAVAANRKLAALELGAPIVFSSQVHGAHAIQVDDEIASAWLKPEPPVTVGEADALLTTSHQVGLGVLVADCVPVLLAGEGVVATAHAGRRGVEQNVIGVIIGQMKAQGAKNIKAAIGPAICGRCYEVPDVMRAEVAELEPKAWAVTRQGTAGLDLPAAVADQLERAGAEVAYRSDVCTLEHGDYFSHRRATQTASPGTPAQTGRQAGLIRLT